MSRGAVSGNGIVTDGLVLSLDAANPRSYVSGSTIWRDLTTNQNNGTLTNGPTFNSNNGGSIQFDGVDDFVSTQPNLGSNPLPIHTIFVWFKTSTSSGKKIIGIEDTPTGTNSIYWDRNIYVGTDGKLYYGVFDTSSKLVSSSISVSNNTWINATAICTGQNSISLYINGLIDATGIGNGYSSYPSSYLRIGGYAMNSFWANASAGYFNGQISNILLYNRALSAAEILQNYNATKTRFGL